MRRIYLHVRLPSKRDPADREAEIPTFETKLLSLVTVQTTRASIGEQRVPEESRDGERSSAVPVRQKTPVGRDVITGRVVNDLHRPIYLRKVETMIQL